MANASKSPQAGAACGRASLPFREKTRGIPNAPLRMNSLCVTAQMVARLGVQGYNTGSLPVVLVGVDVRHIYPYEDKRIVQCPGQERGAAVRFLLHAKDSQVPNAEPRARGVVRDL